MAVVVTITDASAEPVDVTGLLSLEVRKQVNRIPEATLVFSDGRVEDQDFARSSAASFAPGAEVSVSIRRDSETAVPLFTGLVIRHGLDVEGDRSNLRVELRDACLALNGARKTVVHRGKSDKDIISTLLGSLADGTIPKTAPVHEELLQYQSTDWDFMLMRADVLGLLVRVDDGAVSVHEMATPATDAEALSLDCATEEFFTLELELDGDGQNPEFASVGWDAKNKKRLDPVAATELDPSLGEQSAKQVGEDLGLTPTTLEAHLPLLTDELEAWANARLLRSRLALVRGRVVVPGRAARALDTLTLAGVGDRFVGTALITGVIHRYDSDAWRTELELGLDPRWFAREPEIAEPPAAGLLPPIAGLQLGVVRGFKQDEEAKEHRVQVALPSLATSDGAIWARVATPDAGPERGYLFWPSEGDEVVVGFVNADPRQAVILGSTFSSVNAPPPLVGPPTADNFRKAITTATGLTLAFDDERPAVLVQTKNNNKIELDDEAESIVVSDQHGNTITMSADGIAITSAGKLELTAKQDVLVKGASVDLGPS